MVDWDSQRDQMVKFQIKNRGIRGKRVLDAFFNVPRHLFVPEDLIKLYKKASVKHADETSWHNDGQNNYAWLFTTPELSIFRFRKTRSAQVVKEVFGEKALPGVLVVDRYAG